MPYRAFEDARTYARGLGLPTKDAWTTWAHSSARPPDLPIRPDNVYRRRGWVSWYDWLGTTPPAQRWRPFPRARAYAHSLSLDTVAAWRAWSQTDARPLDLPSNPDKAYRDGGWAGWGDWLGTGRRRRTAAHRLPFREARAYARHLGLRSAREWYAWARTAARPEGLPLLVAQVYREHGWAGWADWLGPSYGAPRPRRFRSFAAARAYAHTLGLRSAQEWFRWATTAARPRDIPAHPVRTYQDEGWAGFPDWLGTDPPRQGRRERTRPL